MADHTLVLGIGNTLLSDEGAGIHLLDYLRKHFPDLPNVEYVDGGTLSFTLAAWIEEAGNLIVLDAAELQAAPGTVRVLQGEEMDHFAGRTKRSVHEVSLGDLLSIAHLTGTLPANRALIAVQPEMLEWGSSLSRTVEDALAEAAQLAAGLVMQWQPVTAGQTAAALQTKHR